MSPFKFIVAELSFCNSLMLATLLLWPLSGLTPWDRQECESTRKQANSLASMQEKGPEIKAPSHASKIFTGIECLLTFLTKEHPEQRWRLGSCGCRPFSSLQPWRKRRKLTSNWTSRGRKGRLMAWNGRWSLWMINFRGHHWSWTKGTMSPYVSETTTLCVANGKRSMSQIICHSIHQYISMGLSKFERLIARITSADFVQDKRERRGPTEYLDYRSGP